MNIVDSLKKLIFALNGADSPESIPVKNVDEAIDLLSYVIPDKYPSWDRLLSVLDEYNVQLMYTTHAGKLYWDEDCTEKVSSNELDWKYGGCELLGRCVLLYKINEYTYIPYRPFQITRRGNLNALAYYEGPDTETEGYHVAYAESWGLSEEP